MLIRDPSITRYEAYPSELFLSSYDRLHEGLKERVEDFVENIVWRCERNRHLGVQHQGNLYIVVTPPFADGTKLRIYYADDAEKRRVYLHSLSQVSAGRTS